LTPTACLAQNTENKVCAERFMIYLMSDQADQIKKKHGYCQQAYFAFEDE
jgi:accessory colonization factor AcfC